MIELRWEQSHLLVHHTGTGQVRRHQPLARGARPRRLQLRVDDVGEGVGEGSLVGVLDITERLYGPI